MRVEPRIGSYLPSYLCMSAPAPRRGRGTTKTAPQAHPIPSIVGLDLLGEFDHGLQRVMEWEYTNDEDQ